MGVWAGWVAALLTAATVQMPIGVGNALTLPAQRHLVRIDPGDGQGAIWMFALQQDGADDHGLGWFRSDDEAQTWSYVGPIQDDWSERDVSDLVVVGHDIAMVYSYEGPTLSGSSRHDVYFQWWRYQPGSRTFAPGSVVKVFDSPDDSTAYSRAEIAVDGAGRIWVQAFRLQSDGSSTAEFVESDDGGSSWNRLGALDQVPGRGGGRLLWLGSEVVFVYGMHDGFIPARLMIHRDGDPIDQWSGPTEAFSDGIYHGAALSAVADGHGGMHLVYKNENDERLYYRHFDGSSFGSATLLDNTSDWALQPAITRIGDDLYVFYIHLYSENTDYDFRYRLLHDGSFSSPVVLDGSHNFKGYPASADVIPASVPDVPCFFGRTPDANSGGDAVEVFAPDVSVDTGGTDAGTPDAGTVDAGSPDAGSGGTDGGSGGGTSGLLFSDAFSRTTTDSQGLGANWSITGLWYANNRAISDLTGNDLATETVARCGDCQVQAAATGFGVSDTAIFLRESSINSGNRYQLDLKSNGHIQIQRINGTTTTVLADVASGIADLGSPATLALKAIGQSPVQLTAYVNGVAKVTVNDSSTSAVTSEGYAGLFTKSAGVWFDDFRLDGFGSTGGTDGGTVDAGTPDAGVPDAGSDAGSGGVDAGVPDAGSDAGSGGVDAGVPDAGSDAGSGGVDAGVPDAGSDAGSGGVDAGVPDGGAGGSDGGTSDGGSGGGTSGLLFSDAFNRTTNDNQALGPNWTVAGLWYANNRAISDQTTTELATETLARCADCQVQSQMTGFGVSDTAIFLREGAVNGATRYQLDLKSNGHIQIQRVVNSTVTVLADVASGLSDLGSPATFALKATGAGPVQLTAYVNGVAKASVTDSSSSAIKTAGYAGLYTKNAGVWWDDFRLDGIGTSGGTSDGGTGGVDAGTPDAGSGGVDAGTPDAGSGGVDAGTPDAGSGGSDAGSDGGSGGTTGVLFQDGFNRTSTDDTALGPNWAVSGLWYANNRAISDLDGADRATENVAICGNCQVQATVIGYGVQETAIFLRAPSTSSGDRYELDLTSSGHVQIQRIRSGTTTVLGDAASGLSDLSNPATLTLSAQGNGPVSLSAAVNGVVKLSVTDSSTSALIGSGYAGMFTRSAGVWFDDFSLSGTGSSSSVGTGGSDGGTPDAGTPDAGTPDAGSGGSGQLSLTPVFTDTEHMFLAVDPQGTAYAVRLDDPSTLLASSDGRSWSTRGSASGDFFIMTSLADGTLLADINSGGYHHIARSTDHGQSWSDVLDLDSGYRTLTPHNFAELDGSVYLIEYQDYTESSTTIRLWQSTNDGASWQVRHTFTTHRHGHGMLADPARHALWVYFGDTDAQSGIYRSTDGGDTWTTMLTGQHGDVVDAMLLDDGSILFGQDISYLPPTPHIARLTPSGGYSELSSIPGPSYGAHRIAAGGFVVGSEREPGGDIYPAGEVSAHVFGSLDGVSWDDLLDYPRLSDQDNARADVYWELPDGELVLQLENIQGFGSGGKGYQLLDVGR